MTYLLDSGFLYGLLNDVDSHHERVVSASKNLEGTVYLPTIVTTEVAYSMTKYLGVGGLIAFLDILANPEQFFTLVEPTHADYERASQIVRQYNDSNIDFVDAVVVAIAERMKVTRILTVDQRHFRLFRPRHCTAFEILP